jgi:lipopolysaccharide export LptBFGC system permease protein LptF
MKNGGSPLDTQLLKRMSLAGLILAFVGVGLFILVWNLLGRAEVADLPRLFAAMCVPPAGIAAILGIYLLIFQPRKPSS